MKKLLIGVCAAVAAAVAQGAAIAQFVETEEAGAFELSYEDAAQLTVAVGYGAKCQAPDAPLSAWEKQKTVGSISGSGALSFKLDESEKDRANIGALRVYLLNGDNVVETSETLRRREIYINGSFEDGTEFQPGNNNGFGYSDLWDDAYKLGVRTDFWSNNYIISKAGGAFDVPSALVRGTYCLALQGGANGQRKPTLELTGVAAGKYDLHFYYVRRSGFGGDEHTVGISVNGEVVTSLVAKLADPVNSEFSTTLSLSEGDNTVVIDPGLDDQPTTFVDLITLVSHDLAVFDEPILEARASAVGYNNASVAITSVSAGRGETEVDIYFSSWQEGDEEVEPELVEEGVSDGETVTVDRTGLTPDTRYNWKAVSRNVRGDAWAQMGSFMTKSGGVEERLGQIDITVAGYAGESTLEDFPVLVRFSAAQFPQLNVGMMAADGSDIRFYDAAGNEIAHQIEKWDASGESLIWVKVPELSGTATKIMMKWGKVGARTTTNADTWNDDYVGVWHVEGLGSEASAVNSTRNSGLDAVNNAGQFTVSCFDNYLSDCQTYTYSGWYRLNAKHTGAYAMFGYVKYGTGGDYVSESGDTLITTKDQGEDWLSHISSAPFVSDWQYVSMTSTKEGGYIVYLNGEQKDSGTMVCSARPDKTLPYSLAAYGGDYVQEARVSRVPRSADWVKAEYDTQSSASFLEYTFVQNAQDGLGAKPIVKLNGSPRLDGLGRLRIEYDITWAGAQDAVDELHVVYGPGADQLLTDEIVGRDLFGAGVCEFRPSTAYPNYFIALYATAGGETSERTAATAVSESASNWSGLKLVDGGWQDAANWTYLDGTGEGYPNSSKANVSIGANPESSAARVTLQDDALAGKLTLAAGAPSLEVDLNGHTLACAGVVDVKSGRDLTFCGGTLDCSYILGVAAGSTLTLSNATLNATEANPFQGCPGGIAFAGGSSYRTSDTRLIQAMFSHEKVVADGAGSVVELAFGSGAAPVLGDDKVNLSALNGGKVTLGSADIWYWPIDGNNLLSSGEGSVLEVIFSGGNIGTVGGSPAFSWRAENGGTLRFVNRTAAGFRISADNELEKGTQLIADNGTLIIEECFNFGVGETDAQCQRPTLTVAGANGAFQVKNASSTFGGEAELSAPAAVVFRPPSAGWAAAPIEIGKTLTLKRNLRIEFDLADIDGANIRKLPLMTGLQGLTADADALKNVSIVPGVRGYAVSLFVEGNTLYAKVLRKGLMLMMR